jgi:hypothetical protein
MKTEELVSLLAADTAPADRNVLPKRFALAWLAAIVGATVFMAVVFGLRPDIDIMLKTPVFWIRLGLPLCLGASSLLMVARLSRPGMRVGKAWAGIVVPVLAAWIAALAVLLLAAPDVRLSLFLGHTWRTCAFNIALLSVPAFVAVFWAIKGLAPTRLSQAGAAGGLLAGATGTIAYCLHCPELAIPFWSFWYLLGMLIPTAAGALLGPRLLRW